MAGGAQRPVKYTLPAGKIQNVVLNEAEFIFLKQATKPVNITIEGQNILMEVGEKRRFPTPINSLIIQNPNTTPVKVEIIHGRGDYEKIIVSGEIYARDLLELADGTLLDNNLVDYELSVNLTKSSEFTQNAGDRVIVGADSNRPGGGGFVYNGVLYVGDHRTTAGFFNRKLNMYDPDTLESLGSQSVSMPSGDDPYDKTKGIAINPVDGRVHMILSNSRMWVSFEPGDWVATENVSDYRASLTAGNSVNSLAIGADGFGYVGTTNGRIYKVDLTDFTTVDSYTLSELALTNMGALYSSGVKIMWLDYLKLYAMTVGTSSDLWLLNADFTEYSYFDGVSATHYPSSFELAGGGQESQNYLVAMKYDGYGSGEPIAKHYLESITYPGQAVLTQSPIEALFTPEHIVNIRSGVTLTQEGRHWVADGECIKLLAELFWGSVYNVPDDYLDHIFGIEYFDAGTGRRVKIRSGAKSFSAAEKTDNFKMILGQPVTLTVRDGLLN